MKKILILGGTRYLGLEFIKLLNNSNYQFFVASRKKIMVNNFFEIDRKCQSDLDELFKKKQFDVVVDFINYSNLDSKLLLKSINSQKKVPKLILISTTYTYGLPTNVKKDSIYSEIDFNPFDSKKDINDRDLVSYSEGKRNMESYCTQNYRNDKLVILRFPILLGANDYTKRTQYYTEKISKSVKINPINIDKKSSYIFTIEAANSIINFLNNDHHGIYNVTSGNISEKKLIKLYCNYFNIKFDRLVDTNLDYCVTPFTSNFDFKIDNSKYLSLFPLNIDFEDCLKRELQKI